MLSAETLTVRTVPDLDRPIRYLEQAVGSGKTGLVVANIKAAENENHIFVAPTVALAQEVKGRLTAAEVANVHLLFSEPAKESVRRRALRLINGREGTTRHVLIVTGQTFRTLLLEISPILAAHYNVYLDEGMDAVEHVQLKAENLHQYADLLSTDADGNIVAAPGCIEQLRQVATRDDLVSKQGRENLLTPNFVRIAKLVSSELYDVRGKISDKAISIVALLRPHKFCLFKSVTMVRALWSQSILAMTWSKRYGVRIEPLSHSYPLFDTHKEKGPGMEISFCLHPDDSPSVQNLTRDLVTGEVSLNVPSRRQVITGIAASVAAFFGSRGLDYCWNANSDFKDPEGVLNGNRMPPQSAGLNAWQHLDNVAALVCVNPPTWVKDILLDFLNVDPTDDEASDEVYRQWRLGLTYQTVGRCSLRDRDSKRPNQIVVLSQRCAMDLAEHFPGARIVGQITDLPSYKQFERQKRRAKAPAYDFSDHKAWFRWQQRHPNSDMTKSEWYEKERRFRKSARLDRLAA